MSMPFLAGPRGLAALRATVLVAAAGLPAAVHPATASTSLTVTATVLPSCAVGAASLSFGNYSTTQLDATGSMSVTCTSGTAYTIGLDAGGATSATVSTRAMTGPAAQTLSYSIYRDTTRLLNWGNTVAVDTLAGAGTGSAQTISVYGRVPAAQYVLAGSYSDTVTVTVTY